MTDNTVPYVLICSTFGTVATAQSFAPVFGA
jgi:hypothetical protein